MRPDTSEQTPGLILTGGAVDRCDAVTHPDLGIEVPRDSPRFIEDLLEMGLASEARESGVWGLLFGRSLSRAHVMPRGAGSSASSAAVHWAKGQVRWLVLASASVVVGVFSGLFSLVALAVAWALFAVSVLVHELGHIVAYRVLAPEDAPAIFVVRGMRCHVIRRRLTPVSDIAVALAGPMAPGIVSIFLMSLLLMSLLLAPLLGLEAAGPLPTLTFGAWLALAASHAISAALPFGDGATIREGWRLARAERSS